MWLAREGNTVMRTIGNDFIWYSVAGIWHTSFNGFLNDLYCCKWEEGTIQHDNKNSRSGCSGM